MTLTLDLDSRLRCTLLENDRVDLRKRALVEGDVGLLVAEDRFGEGEGGCDGDERDNLEELHSGRVDGERRWAWCGVKKGERVKT
jgi:hypothetical protein